MFSLRCVRGFRVPGFKPRGLRPKELLRRGAGFPGLVVSRSRSLKEASSTRVETESLRSNFQAPANTLEAKPQNLSTPKP